MFWGSIIGAKAVFNSLKIYRLKYSTVVFIIITPENTENDLLNSQQFREENAFNTD